MEKRFTKSYDKIEANEEKHEWVEEVVEFGYDLYIKTKRRVFARGFAMGVTTAVAIQSVITIIVLLGK